MFPPNKVLVSLNELPKACKTTTCDNTRTKLLGQKHHDYVNSSTHLGHILRFPISLSPICHKQHTSGKKLN